MLSPLFALAWVFGLCSALLFLLWHCRNALLARVLPQGGDLIDIELAGDVFLPFDILPKDTAVPEHVIASLPVFLFPGDGDGASSNTLQPSAATPQTKAAASAASAAGGSDPVDACASPAADNATAAQQQQQQEAMTWVQKLCAQQQSEERAQQQQQRQALADAAKHYTGISLTPQPDQSKAGQPARDGSSDAGSRSSRSSSSSSEDGCSASSGSSSQRGHRAGSSSSSSSSSSRSCAARLCRRLPQPQQQQCDVLLQQDMKACRATHQQQQQQQHMDGDAGCSSSSSTSTSCDGGGGGSATLLSSSDSLSCVICCDDYQAADLVKQLPCKHCMHAKCIDAWLRTPRSCGSCPLCKVPVWQPALAVRSSAHGCFILTLTSSSLERRGVARQVQGEGGVAMAAPPAANVATIQTE